MEGSCPAHISRTTPDIKDFLDCLSRLDMPERYIAIHAHMQWLALCYRCRYLSQFWAETLLPSNASPNRPELKMSRRSNISTHVNICPWRPFVVSFGVGETVRELTDRQDRHSINSELRWLCWRIVADFFMDRVRVVR